MRFSIRDFHSQDFETLWAIDQKCFARGISYSRPELAAYLKVPGSFSLVAQDAGTATGIPDDGSRGGILGFVVANLNRAKMGHIITIDVLPQAQRAGVGSALLRAAEDQLIANGCALVRLETAANNTSALAFYKRHGYFVMHTIRAYYPDGMDALVLKKDLLSSPSGS